MESKSLNKTKSKHKILIVDDHAVVREGLRWVIEQSKDLVVSSEASDATEAMLKINEEQPDLMIIDIALPGTSGLDLTKKIRSSFPDIRILILSMYKEELYAERALRSGAHGYLSKNDSGEKLITAIRQVLLGQVYVSKEFNEMLLKRLGSSGLKPAFSLDLLTNRELDVLRLIGQGYGSKEIAADLKISMKTVEAHREHIRGKLDLHTNSQLVQHAIHWVHSENIPVEPKL
jgi:DNA-binding NarL/FixJ family response regulator